MQISVFVEPKIQLKKCRIFQGAIEDMHVHILISRKDQYHSRLEANGKIADNTIMAIPAG
jgi:hypothetical protein